HEIMGHRSRYRLIDLERFCRRLGTSSLEDVRENLTASFAERIARDRMEREPGWTESLAVGSAGFVKGIQPQIRWRSELEIVETAEGGTWLLQESAVPFGQNPGPKGSSEGAQRADFFHIPSYP